MSTGAFLTLAFLSLLSAVLAGATLVLLRKMRGGDADAALLQKLADLQQALTAQLGAATADTAARVEKMKGDLQLAQGSAMAAGFTDLRSGVETKLAEGRTEQGVAAKSLREEMAKSLALEYGKLQEQFRALESQTGAKLEQIRATVEGKLLEISGQVQQKLEKNIQEGFAHFVKVQEHLKAAEEQLRNVGAVGSSINELNALLKLPHLRGRFGEMELERLLADFLPAEIYKLQVPVAPDSRDHVDALILFPEAKLPVDSKFNREQILPLFETSDPEKLKAARVELERVIDEQARSIAKKYIHPEHGTTEMALMFIPSETIYFEIIRNGALCEKLHRSQVFPVSPNTLAITLRSVAMSFSHYQFAKNVEKIVQEIKLAQKHYANFQKQFEDVGKKLSGAQQAYEVAGTHLRNYTTKVGRFAGQPLDESETAPELPSPEG